jgi:hypothetical protein
MTNMNATIFIMSLFSMLIESMSHVNDNIIQKLDRNFPKIKDNCPQNPNLV